MAEKKPLRFILDELGNPVRLGEFQAGETLPKAVLPALTAADVGADPAGAAASAAAAVAADNDARHWMGL